MRGSMQSSSVQGFRVSLSGQRGNNKDQPTSSQILFAIRFTSKKTPSLHICIVFLYTIYHSYTSEEYLYHYLIMPPRRKPVVASTTRTLHSFSTVGKSIFKTGKPTSKASIITETKKKEQAPHKLELVPTLEIQQDGDEDVVIKREPVKVKLAKVESVKVKPIKPSSSKTKPSTTTTTTTPSSKRKRTLLDSFVSSPAKKREIFPLKGTRLPAPSTTSNPETDSIASASTTLPADLTLLQLLHSSLLTALLLHRAHNNNSIHPPVFAAIKLHVERLCRRKITLEDVQKIVYLSHYATDQKEAEEHWEIEGGLKLVDYGNNKICIDFAEKTKARKLVNSDNLKRDFAARVTTFWKSTNAGSLPTPPASFSTPLKSEDNEEVEPKSKEEEEKEEEEDVEAKPEEEAEIKPQVITIPMSIIPLAKLHVHPKAATIAKVLHTKGQQRLDDLLRRHKQPTISFPSSKNSISTAPPAKRGSSLLDRIRAKAALAVEAAANAPSKEELERTAAEQRVPDIEPILKGLAARGSNMTMKACVEGIRESVRNPVSGEQAEMAVRLIAEREGEGGWVTVREVGRVVGVVFGRREAEGEFM